MSRQLAASPLMQQHLLNHIHLPGNIFGQHSVLHQLGADVDADGDEDAVYLSPWAVGLAALLLLINGLFSVYLSLGLHKTLGTAAIRCTIQLTILGYILVPIFSYDRWWLVLLYAGLQNRNLCIRIKSKRL